PGGAAPSPPATRSSCPAATRPPLPRRPCWGSMASRCSGTGSNWTMPVLPAGGPAARLPDPAPRRAGIIPPPLQEILMPSRRQLHFVGAAFCAALLGVALYMEHVMGLTPCYLCIVQRVFVLLTGLVLLAAALHDPGRIGQRIYAGLGALSALLGGGFSTRQLWLQSLPADQVPACGPPADYL